MKENCHVCPKCGFRNKVVGFSLCTKDPTVVVVLTQCLKDSNQKLELIECEEERCTIYGVESVAVDREEEKATLEVNHEDFEKRK